MISKLRKPCLYLFLIKDSKTRDLLQTITMKLYKLTFLIFLFFPPLLFSQVSEEAQALYDQGKYRQAKLLLEKELEEKPTDAYINYWLGRASLYTGDLETAEKSLSQAKRRSYHDATLYLGRLYAMQYNFEAAEKEFTAYRRVRRRNKESMALLEEEEEYANRLQRLLSRTEDIQIIDSVVVAKNDFLSAYNLSASGGSIQWARNFFGERDEDENSVVFMNERETKLYFSRPATEQGSTLYTMEKMVDNFGNEKQLPSPINTSEDQGYPFIMADGLTIYFASKGHGSIGGYDLFVSRYNLYSDTYLNPNQMNMPFNSPFNDYMLVIDEEKGIGWFASDRYQAEDTVCVYTFIPNQEVRLIQTEKEDSLANRAKISNIKDSWREGVHYTNLLNKARTISIIKESKQHDFEFVINNDYTYHHLSDFNSFSAREIFIDAMEIEKQLEEAQKELTLKREQYAATSSSNNATLTAEILLMEKTVAGLYDQCKVMKVMARNEEIKHINSSKQ